MRAEGWAELVAWHVERGDETPLFRQIYQAALDRFVREYAAVERIDEMTATQRVEQMLAA